MKIIFLNVKARVVEVYGENGVSTIPFSGVHRIKEALKTNDDILYITNAVKTNTQDVVKMVNDMNTKSLNYAIEHNEPLYIRSTGKGVIRIEALKLTFNGPADFKPLDDILAKFGKNILEKDLTLRKLRENGYIEVLSQHDIDAVSNYLKAEKIKKQEKMNKEKEKREGTSKEGKDNDDMWSDKNSLALNAGSLGGGGSAHNNESGLITDDML